MNILQQIGNTPMVELEYFAPAGRKLYAKLEGNNPGGSIKDRIAISMLDAAERENLITSESIIVEPTSGNTGIGLALVSAAKGYKCIIVMPENMSVERQKILKFFGAEVILTPAEFGMQGAIDRANEIVSDTENAYMPDQFSNPANPMIHRETTAAEIESQLNLIPTAFVAGVGTGGTIMGVAQYFKLDRQADVKIIAVEPSESAVLSGLPKGKHNIQGIGAGFIPPIFDGELVDAIEKISTDEALETSRALAKKMGIPAGISSGANLAASIKVAKNLPPESIITTVFPDRIDRYLSII
ncbi:cysteine synthase A [bacterium]|nr:MAG: cysteine synthase A [bacterium]